ncbi:hypothetical protein IX339_000740 [Porphyromonas levii]|uniref:YfhO family protein n=1 Tax=Porphyromonas levii TaxID=28114 RepID=UPI001B8C0606|nr:YfhO family protein [Porphyromonas levii]MBR8731296.1 hypothetical protein [Porphyromonas levii]
MDKQKWYHQSWVQIVGVVLLFLVIALAYFYPAAFEGRQLFQADGAAAAGTGRDVVEYMEQTGERSFWTGSLFGGMPTYQISPSYPSAEGIKAVQKIYSPRGILLGESYLIFMLLIGFYIFMRSWGIKRQLSVGGAIMWAFSSYFLILIDAGHIWKLLALTYIPPTIAGLVLAFHRRKYLLGFFVTGLFSALQIYSNHIQMSYYFAFLMLAMIIAWAIEAGRKKEWAHFAKAFGVVVAGGLIGIAINGTSLYHTYEYGKETMRGGREITVLDNPNATQVTNNGLDHAYITQWSYGIDEMLTFLIPDAKGGASGAIPAEEVQKSNVSNPQLQQILSDPRSGMNRYWGDQPFTAGPVYIGAIVLLLALFGMMVAKGPMKWSLIGVTALTIMLSWGHNFMWLSELFIDYFPLYDKFRTPSSILVVAEFTLPLFAIWGLVLILREPAFIRKHKTEAIIATALTLGVALILYIIPSLSGGFLSKYEADYFSTVAAQNPDMNLLRGALESVREHIFKSDTLRTISFLILSVALLFLYDREKVSKQVMLPLLVLLIFVDLWSVDKRFLNDGKYMEASQVTARVTETTAADQMILADTTQYRVFNTTVNTFNDATTSYNHRSVGGYHAAKLQRYQDIIEGYLVKRDLNVLRALNTKYYIVPDSVGVPTAVTDPDSYGNAWFVGSVKPVSTPDEEFTALGEVSLNQVAVLAGNFADKAPSVITPDSLASISLVSYAPNRVKYRTTNNHEGVAVFSEIYYPHGWHATIDGAPTEILRADYILRALVVPQGEHEVEFVFDPQSLHTTEAVAIVGSILLAIAGIGIVVYYFLQRRRHGANTPA